MSIALGTAGAIAAGKAVLGTGLAAGGVSALGKGAGALIGSMSPTARAARKNLKADMDKLKSGKLGFSQAEKQNMLRLAAQGMAGQNAQASAKLGRKEASLGFGRSGLVADQQKALGQTAAQAMTTATGKVETDSTAAARAEKARILQAILTQRNKVQNDWQNAMGGAVDTGMSAALDKKNTDTLAGALAASQGA